MLRGAVIGIDFAGPATAGAQRRKIVAVVAVDFAGEPMLR
jgi:hypothetical protein